MQNQEIVKIIENLKGRRNYEEKRATKLGFASLYEYFEDKISKKQKALEDEQKELETAYKNNKYQRDRAIAYPSIVDQLDDLYHNGIDGWKTTIKATKDKYPKS